MGCSSFCPASPDKRLSFPLLNNNYFETDCWTWGAGHSFRESQQSMLLGCVVLAMAYRELKVHVVRLLSQL